MSLANVKYQHRVMGLLALLSIVTYLDRVCIAVAGPRMQDSLHLGPEAWGWVTSIFFLSYTAFEIPTGIMGDRIGPRRVLTRIVLWWSVFTSLTGAISGYFVLLAVRFLFGVGEAGAYPNMNIVLARWIPPAKRASAWGLIFMTTQIGAAISPLLVVPIQMRYGWRASFYLFGFLGVLWGAVWYWWFRDSPAAKPGITPAELAEIGPQSEAIDAVRHEGVQWGLALRSGPLWRISCIGGCYLYTMAFFQSWLQTYLVRGRGYSEAALVLSSLPYLVGAAAAGLGGVLSDWLVRRLGLRNGRRTLGVFGLSVAALFMIASLLTPNNTWALVFLTISYTGILLQQPNLCAVVLDMARKNAGGVFAFLNTVSNAASALSTVVFGYMVGYFGNYTAPFIPMILTLALGAMLWMRVDPTHELFATEKNEVPLTACEIE